MEAKERTWVKLRTNDIWKPATKGDYLEGVFTRIEKSEFKGKESLGYVITQEGTEEETKIYGAALKKLMALIEPGTFVRIIYQGSKNLGGYKNLKLYDVLVDESDAPEGCYDQLEEGSDESNGLLANDDPESRNEIELIKNIIGENATCKEILKYADDHKEEMELGEEELKRLAEQCGRMYKL